MKQNRTQIIKQLLQYAAALMILFIGGTSCTKIEDTALNGDQRTIQLTAYKPNDTDLASKADPKEAFTKGDLIHVSAKFTLSDVAGSNEIVYACMQYDANGNWSAIEGTKLIWPLKATKATFTAYYIPNTTSALGEGNVAKLSFSELSQWASDKGGDPLKATCTDVTVGGAVYLQFAHMCTKLTFTNLGNDISELRLSGDKLSSGLTINRRSGELTDNILSLETSDIIHNAKGGEVSFLLPEIAKNYKLKLFNRYTPFHQISVPHKLETGKHYKLDITKLADNGYSEDYKEEQWKDDPSTVIQLGTDDINKYLQAISDGEEYIKDKVQILAIFQEGNNSVVTQLRDVDFGSNIFTPVNISGNIIFNGNGHTVKGVKISESLNNYSAIFGKNEGVIKNLTLDGVTTENLPKSEFVGTLAAYNSGTIDNVKVKFAFGNTVQGTIIDGKQLWVGGLVGYNARTIKNVLLSGDFTVEGTNATTGIAHVGGLVGQTSGTVESCVIHNATVNSNGTGTFRIGGFTGTIGDGSVSKCTVNGTVEVSEVVNVVRAGGFAGYSSAAIKNNGVTECSSNTPVTVAGASQASIGGFIGQVHNSTIDNCHATGEVIVSGTITTPKGIAGLVGWLSYKGKGSASHIKNCSTISAVDKAYGGLVGFVANEDDDSTTDNKNCSIFNSFSKNTADNFVANGDGVDIKNWHHNGKNTDGDITVADLNNGSGPGLKWTEIPNLYGVPYLNRNK